MIATCPETEMLREFVLGKLDEPQSETLTDHVRDCRECQARLADVDAIQDTFLGSLRDSTAGDGYREESECKAAMARALAALADTGDMVDSDEPAIGREIGEYEIVRQIGSGGMGSVYLAQHTKLNRRVAVKVLATHRLSDPRMHERFRKEMRVIGSLSHPSIVTAHDAREVDGVALLVTEWIDGLDLREVMQRIGAFSVPDACAVTTRIVEALVYAKSKGLVHRDLKPSNVMISRNGEVKLLDLGLARLVQSGDEQVEATATGQTLGTADYVSPEQINDAHDVDHRSDVYGLGCTLFKLLSGRAPFEDPQHATAFAKMTAHVSETAPTLRSIVPTVPSSLNSLVQRMIHKDPAERPSLDEVGVEVRALSKASDLDGLVRRVEEAESRSPGATPTSAHSATATPQTFWRRRVPVTVAIAAAMGGMILGLFSGFLLTIHRADGTKGKVLVPDNTEQVAIGPNGDVDVTLAAPSGVARPTGANPYSGGVSDLSDAKQLTGVWRIDAVMDSGRPGKSPLGAMVFRPPHFAVLDGDRAMEVGSMSLNESQQTLRFESRTGTQAPKRAIYRFLKSGHLQICMNERDPDSVPTEFASSADPDSPNDVLVTLSRVEFPIEPMALLSYLRDPSNRTISRAVSLYASWSQAEGIGEKQLKEAIAEAKKAAAQTTTSNHLKQLGIAFHNFHDAYRRLPASAAIRQGAGPEGKQGPPHSWRVAVLPFVECADLYDQYRFDQPWDSEHNSRLLDQMPDIFRKPDAPKDSTVTGIVGFVGDDTMLGRSEGTRFVDVRDGLSNTILLVDTDLEIPWTKPQDLDLKHDAEIDLSAVLDLGSVLTLMGDASVRTLEALTPGKLSEGVRRDDGKFVRRR